MTLAHEQAALARALVGTGPVPTGFDAAAVEAAAEALLRKRADEVAHHRPALLARPSERAAFVEWARGRPKTSSCADGEAFAEHLLATGALPSHARAEFDASRSGARRRRRR